MKKYQIALDIGASKILAGLVFGQKIIYKIKKPTQAQAECPVILKNITGAIKEVMTENKLDRRAVQKIGLALAGQIDIKKGLVLSTGNFSPKFKNIALAKILTDKFGLPVKIDNDVKCFLSAEKKFGAAKEFDNAVGLTLGTGIGAGIMVNGQLLRGLNNSAGEIGHMKIAGQWPDEKLSRCGCGGRSCFESLASGRAWQKIYQKYGATTADRIIIKNITTGLLNLAYTLNPQIFILGGGLMEHTKILAEIKKEFYGKATFPWFKKIKIVRPKLGDEAILLGSLI